jgi:hypothetical protein
MNIKFTITKAMTRPHVNGLADVIGKVFWEVTFEQDGLKSKGVGETVLDAPTSESFVEFAQLTEQQIIDWVIAKEGGEAFVNMLTGIHNPILERLAQERGLQEVVLPFASEAQSVNQQAASAIYQGPKAVAGVIPTVIL